MIRRRRSYRRSATLLEQGVALVGRFLTLALILGGLWLVGLVWYVAAMPRSVTAPEQVTDAIVVLTGGSERLVTGLDLLRQDKADVLFITGVHSTTTLEALLAESGAAPLPESLRLRIVIGHVALDTIGNAIETAVWLNETGYRSVRLVTAAYHMPRSLLEFRMAAPEVEIIPHPVFPPVVKTAQWWYRLGTGSLFISEYTKFLVAHLRLLFPDTPPRYSHVPSPVVPTLPQEAEPKPLPPVSLEEKARL